MSCHCWFIRADFYWGSINMNSDIQSILAIMIVVVAAGIYIYLTFMKKKSGCGAGCGCSSIPKKPAAPQKSVKPEK